MSYLFSLALVEDCLQEKRLDGEPFAQLNKMHNAQKFWHKDKTMDHLSLSQFGLTLKVLTEDLGKELLMSYLAGFLVRTLAPRETEPDSAESDLDCGGAMARIIGEVQPRFAFVENSPLLSRRGLGIVLGDLAEMGFDAEWGVLSASDVGAPHQRKRIWIVAYSHGVRLERRNSLDQERHGKTETGSVSGLDQMYAWPDVSNPRAFGSDDGMA